MKASRLVVAAAVIGGSVYGMKGCLSAKAPDEKLAGHIQGLCTIAHDNIETPARGVQKLGVFLGNHLGDMLGELGDTLAAIETTRDDQKHDDRARLARTRLTLPSGCSTAIDEFDRAVENDEEAMALMRHFSVRFNRTLEIFFDGAKVRDVRALEHELETLLR